MKYSTRLYVILLLFLAFLNIFDGIATGFFICQGVIAEANPLMAYLIETDLFLFLGVKFIVSLGALYLLWLRRESQLARVAILPVVFLYLYIFFKHLSIAFNVLW